MTSIFLKERNTIFSIKLGQRLPKSFSQLHVENSRFFLSKFLKKDDWPKAADSNSNITIFFHENIYSSVRKQNEEILLCILVIFVPTGRSEHRKGLWTSQAPHRPKNSRVRLGLMRLIKLKS